MPNPALDFGMKTEYGRDAESSTLIVRHAPVLRQAILAVAFVAGCGPSSSGGAAKPPLELTSGEKTALRKAILNYFRTLPPANFEVSVQDLKSDGDYKQKLVKVQPIATHTCSSGFGTCSIFNLGRFWTDGALVSAHFDSGNIDSGPSSERFVYYYYFRPNSVGEDLIRKSLVFTHSAALRCPAIVDSKTAMVGTVRLNFSDSEPRDFSLADVGLSGPLETKKDSRDAGEICALDSLR